MGLIQLVTDGRFASKSAFNRARPRTGRHLTNGKGIVQANRFHNFVRDLGCDL
jgi:hypothetical protein